MVGPEARLREGLFTPLSHCFMGEGWGEGAGEPAKIAKVPDSPSAPVRLCIWQRPKTHTLTLSLVRERASMSASLRNSMRAIFALQTVFRHSHPGEGIKPRAGGELHCSMRKSTGSSRGRGNQKEPQPSTADQLR